MNNDLAHYRVNATAPTLAPRGGATTYPGAGWAMISSTTAIEPTSAYVGIADALRLVSDSAVGIIEPASSSIAAIVDCVVLCSIMMRWGGFGGGYSRSMRAQWTTGSSVQYIPQVTSPDNDLYDMGASNILLLQGGDAISPQFMQNSASVQVVEWTMTFVLLEGAFGYPGGGG